MLNERAAAQSAYRGRFAPTPSGPLHAGSLLTAVASYLDARAAGGRWLLRIDDLDRQRCRAEHVDTILRQLEGHGLLWDEAPRRQSEHLDDYLTALQRLRERLPVYRCGCTRKQLRGYPGGILGPIYPGSCRRQPPPAGAQSCLRLAVPEGVAELHDDWQPPLRLDWRRELGDFVLWRADDTPGYALASAVDEMAQGITHLVRGVDLLPATLQHFLVLRLLGAQPPVTRHGPLLVNARGKLSKQNRAAPVAAREASANLLACCRHLGLALAASMESAAPAEVLDQAVAAWRRRPRPSSLSEVFGA